MTVCRAPSHSVMQSEELWAFGLLETMVTPIGRVLEIWRYPISSVGGERLARGILKPKGIVGDRLYALIDITTGLPAAPELDIRWRKALYLTAALTTLSFPSGPTCALDDPALTDLLTNYFGFPCALAAYEPNTNSRLPQAHKRYVPAPIHLLTTASLTQLSALCELGAIDARRFRPTLLIDMFGKSGLIEDTWLGRSIRFGEVNLIAREKTKRCGMTLLSQPDLDEEPVILRTLLKHNRRNFGIYCDVVCAGSVEVGDTLSIDG